MQNNWLQIKGVLLNTTGTSILFTLISFLLKSFIIFLNTGVTGKMTTETAHDDDNFGTETSSKVSSILYHILFSYQTGLFVRNYSLNKIIPYV